MPYFILGTLDVLPEEEAYSKARKAATRALELDETIAEAHTALGVMREVLDWNWLEAENAFKRATALNPSSREAHREYGLLLSRMGKTREGVTEMKRALEVDPLSEIANAYVAWAYIYDRQYDAAIEQCRKTLALNPNSGMTHFMLGETYLHKGMYKEAIAVLETETVTKLSRSDAFAYLGCAYAVSGNKEKALKILAELKEQYKQGNNVNIPVPIAQLYTGLGEKNEALGMLERANEDHAPFFLHLIRNPIFDPLHSEPRFEALLKKMRL